MSWKLVFALSLLGLAMGVATVFAISSELEPWFWLAVLLVSATAIAKRAPDKYFLHGIGVGLLDGLWAGCVHWALFERYAVAHAHEVALLASRGEPRTTMLVVAPIAGTIGGIVLGALSWMLSKFLVSSHSEYAGW